MAGIPVCLCANSEIDAAKQRANRILAEAETSPNYQRLLDRGDARTVGDLCAAGDEESMSDLHDVMRVISACDIVVGSRYHVLVAGLKLRRPCVSLGYGPKHQALLESAGIGQFSQAADDFDLPLLIAQIEAIVADLEHYKRTVATSIDRLEANLSGVDAFLRQSMSNGVHKAQVYGDAADAIAPQ